MTGSDVNRKFKDGVFRTLFNDEEKLLELYNALSNRNYPEGTPIEIVTLDNVIFNEIKNDIAFIIDDRFIILTEHQSTKSPNFPLRMLCYLAKEYEKKYYSDAIYSTRLVTLPTPELYVFYEGKKDAPVEWELKLSEEFREKSDTKSEEAVVKVINVSYEKVAELLERCKTMQEFSLFMYMIRKKYDETGNLMTAVSESIYECINSDVLKEYLMEHRGDIMSVLEVNLTIEEREAIRWRDGYEDGREAGAQNERLLIAKNLKIDGIPIDIIAKNTGLTVEEIEEL
ncbi:MAG: hypothetical protein IJB14_06630 [Firmicutes bacterium]|nr:hypothetical protein [Bacillota bacterium]